MSPKRGSMNFTAVAIYHEANAHQQQAICHQTILQTGFWQILLDNPQSASQ